MKYQGISIICVGYSVTDTMTFSSIALGPLSPHPPKTGRPLHQDSYEKACHLLYLLSLSWLKVLFLSLIYS